MASLGMYPIGSRPITALRRATYGPIGARLLAAGTAAFTVTATAIGAMAVTSAGNGAAAFTSGNGKGALSSAGVGAYSAAMSAKASSVLTGAGTGATSLQLSSIARSVLSSNCTGTFTPVMTAKVSSNASMQGSSTFGGTDSPGSTINFSGVGTFNAVGYSVYLGAEKAGPAFEQRMTWATPENRVAVAPYEDRVYYTKSKPTTQGPPNRRRTL